MGTIGRFSHPNAIATPRMVQIHSAVHRGDGAWRQSTALGRDYGCSPFASCQQAAKAPLRHDGFNIRSCP